MIRRVSSEQWLAIGVIVLGLVMAWQIQLIPEAAGYARIGPRFFPGLIVTGLILCGGALLLKASRPTAVATEGDKLAGDADEAERGETDLRMFLLASGALLAHMALIGLIGFTLAGTLLCFGICYALETKNPLRDAALSFLLAWGLFHLFKTLGLNLPALISGVL
jgi:putative tricarboxylic transport membrane protein